MVLILNTYVPLLFYTRSDWFGLTIRVFFICIFLYTDLPGAPENLITECYATSCVYTWEEPPLGDFTKKELMFRFFAPQHGFESRLDYVKPAQGKVMTPLVPNTNYSLSASTLLFLNSRKIDIGRRTVHSFRTRTVGKWYFIVILILYSLHIVMERAY